MQLRPVAPSLPFQRASRWYVCPSRLEQLWELTYGSTILPAIIRFDGFRSSFRQQFTQIRLFSHKLFSHLDNYSCLLQVELIAILQCLVSRADVVIVADVVANLVINHDAVVEGMEAYEAILPTLRLSS